MMNNRNQLNTEFNFANQDISDALYQEWLDTHKNLTEKMLAMH